MADEQEVVLTENDILGILKNVRSLTPDQWIEREIEADKVVRKSLGPKPKKQDFKREGKRKLGLIEWMMLALLVVLFFFSILHVFTWARNQAIHSYATLNKPTEGAPALPNKLGVDVGKDGITIGEDWYVLLHQLSVLGVTELGMVALSIWHIYRAKFAGLEPKGDKKRFALLFWWLNRYFFMLLAAACGIVVLGANLSSGFDPAVSFLVPVLTISLSEIFARIAGEAYTENLDLELAYRTADTNWRNFTQEPRTHETYPSVLTYEIQSWYRKNSAYRNVPWSPVLLRYLSAREKAAHVKSLNDDELVQRFAALAEAPLADQAAGLSSGSSATQPQLSSPTPSDQSSPGPELLPPPIPSTSNGQHDPNLLNPNLP